MVSEAGKKKVTECLVGDSTASILLKARGKEAEELKEGRSVRLQGCKVDMYHGSMRLQCAPDVEIDDIDEVLAKVRSQCACTSHLCFWRVLCFCGRCTAIRIHMC